VVTVLSSVASNCIDGSVVTTKRNIESNDSVASLDHVEIFLRDIGLGGSAVEEELDLLEETWLGMFVELRTEVGWVNSRYRLRE